MTTKTNLHNYLKSFILFLYKLFFCIFAVLICGFNLFPKKAFSESVLAEFNFDNSSFSPSGYEDKYSADYIEAGIANSEFFVGTGLEWNNTLFENGHFGGNRNQLGFTENADEFTTLSDAKLTNDYLDFTITPSDGNQYTISGFNIDVIIGSVLKRPANIFTLEIIDSESNNIYEETFQGYSSVVDSVNFHSYSFSTPYSFENETVFRVYIYNSKGDSSLNSETYFDNIMILGSVSSIPETSTSTLIVGFLVFITTVYFRRKF